MASVMRQFQDSSYLFGGNAPFIEDLYEKYLVNPQSVPDEWRDYFDRMQVLPGSATKDVAHAPVVEPAYYDLKEADLEQVVNSGSFVGLDRVSLRTLIQALRDTYCRNIGFE